MRHLTIVFAYYENPGMLDRQLAAFEAMPAAIQERLRLIIVDDGSPTAPARIRPCGVPVRLLRMKVDVRWNQDACRNLALHHADKGWVLMTDIDHLIPVETIRAVLLADLDEKAVYRFSRVSEPDMQPYKPHPNSWLMTKGMFNRIGGYDERFAGLYGTDGEFRDRVQLAAPIITLPQTLIRVPREVTPDSSTTTYLRKQPEDAEGIPRVKAERARTPNWRPLRLTFPWEHVAAC
jgi:hypothetical protein